MKTTLSNQSPSQARHSIFLACGTTAIRCLKALRTWEIIHGYLPEDWAKILGFDAKGVTHSQLLSTVNKDLQDISLGPGEVFGAAIGDLESRRLAERSGRIWMSPPGYYKDPGIAGGDAGAGGIARNGRTELALNEEIFGAQLVSCLRQCQDYQQQRPGLGKEGTDQPVVQVYVIASFVGGTGPGTFIPTTAMIAEKAAALKIHVRITPIVLLMGTLNPGDQHSGARNQQVGLRSLQAHFQGKLRSLTSSEDGFQRVCDVPILLSNANAFGEIPNLKRLVALAGQWLYLLIHRPLGPILYQECINLQDQAVKDASGDLRSAATAGMAMINSNKEKVQAGVIVKRKLLFLSSLLSESADGAGIQTAVVVFAAVGLKETPTDDTATQRLYRLSHQGSPNVLERARAVFQQRMGGGLGFKACREMVRAGHFALDQEVPHFLAPKMAEEAEAIVHEGHKTLAHEISRCLQKQTGLAQGAQFLEKTQELLEASETANQQKLARAQQRQKDLRRAKAACEKLYHRLQKTIWLFRWLRIFLMATFRRTYPRYVEALIRTELELVARKQLAKRVFPGIRRALRAQQGRLNRIKQGIQTLRDGACQEESRLDNLADDFYVPVGYELADRPLIERVLAEILSVEGGASKAVRKLFDRFCERYGSLEAFGEHLPEAIGAYLADDSRRTVAGVVERLDFLDVFKATFPTEAQQSQVIATVIGQSDGRLKTSGECHRDIPRIKYIVGPNDQSVHLALAIANRVNRQGGDWRGHVEPTATGLHFIQYRAGVSITQQIRDTTKFYHLPDDPKELVQLGEDPIVALAPDTDVSADKLDVSIGHAVTSGQIHRNGRGCELRRLGQSLVLGTTLDEIRAALAASYEVRIEIYRGFCLLLTQDQKRLLNEIETILAQYASDPAKLIVPLDKAAFDMVRAQAFGLVPYTSRMRLDPRIVREGFGNGDM